MKKKYAIFLTLIILTACELVVDVDVPFDGEQMTINSLFSPDSLWRVSVSLNRYILDDQPFKRVTNATVVISDENGPIETLVHEGGGIYRSDNVKPMAGKIYTLSATSPIHGTVQAQSFAPPAASFSNVDIQSNDFNGEPSSRISLQISDDPTTENYYGISVDVGWEFLNSETFEIITQRYPAYLGRNDDGIQNEELAHDNSLLIKDVFYTGPKLNVTVHSPDWNLLHAGLIFVTVKTLSKDYYDFILTSSLQNETSGNPFAQPVQVHSNVQNGFGIFAGSSGFTVEKSKPKPVITSIPASVRRGVQMAIEADNLSSSSTNNTTAVIFESNGQFKLTYGYPFSVSGNRMQIWVPQDAKSGRLWLTTNGRVVEWEAGITVVD